MLSPRSSGAVPVVFGEAGERRTPAVVRQNLRLGSAEPKICSEVYRRDGAAAELERRVAGDLHCPGQDRQSGAGDVKGRVVLAPLAAAPCKEMPPVLSSEAAVTVVERKYQWRRYQGRRNW